MALTLTSAERVREPGFSREKCVILATRIECGDFTIRPSEQFHRGSTGRLNAVTPHNIATIVAALRAYANG